MRLRTASMGLLMVAAVVALAPTSSAGCAEDLALGLVTQVPPPPPNPDGFNAFVGAAESASTYEAALLADAATYELDALSRLNSAPPVPSPGLPLETSWAFTYFVLMGNAGFTFVAGSGTAGAAVTAGTAGVGASLYTAAVNVAAGASTYGLGTAGTAVGVGETFVACAV